jgi:hypothetical protein
LFVQVDGREHRHAVFDDLPDVLVPLVMPSTMWDDDVLAACRRRPLSHNLNGFPTPDAYPRKIFSWPRCAARASAWT